MIKSLLIAYVSAVRIELQRQGEETPDFRGIAEGYVNEKNTDGEAGLTIDEVEDRFKGDFTTVDTNADGVVDAAEIATWIEANPQVLEEGQRPDFLAIAEEYINANNTDGEAGLTVDEVEEKHRGEFGNVDADGSGSIDAHELATWIEANQWVLFQDHAIDYINENNTDGEAGLTINEVEDRFKGEFTTVDTNGDGVVDAKEISVWIGANQWVLEEGEDQGPDFHAIAQEYLNNNEKNGEAGLTIDEVEEKHRGEFGNVDANGDGAIDVDELAAWIEANQWVLFVDTAQDYVNEMNTDGDAGLSINEVEDRFKGEFTTVDTDGNGVVDAKEIAVWIQANQWVLEEGEGEGPDLMAIAEDYVKANNADGAAGLTIDEVEDQHKEVFGDVDTDQSGTVSASEIAAWLEANQWALEA